jgi:RimJ/RimL family protein N-acetyltransferase
MTDQWLPSDNPDPAPAPRHAKPPYSDELYGSAFFLKRIRPGEVSKDYLAWLSDPDVIRFLQVRFSARDEASISTFIESFDHVDRFLFGIHDAADNRYIGNITLRVDPNHLFAHMGYLIGDKRYWSSRAALDAVTLICDFAFFERGARKILEPTTDDHIASNFNFRRLGFTYEGKFPDLYWSGGTYRAAVYWSMTARHWAELREHDPNEVTR